MPAGNNRINFQIGYTVDKAGLEQMQSLFQQIANKAKEPGNELNKSLQQAGKTAEVLDGILEKTFNTNLGTLNVTKFNQELSKSGLTLRDVQTRLVASGNQGATAYNKLAQSILGTNQQLKQGNKLLDDMADTFTKTVKWGIASSVFNNITNSIQKAYDFTKNLDTSLNDIRIVTDKSAESMERFAQQAQEAAKGMGASTLDYTNAALIYYQQGLTDAEVQARAETTLKAANVTGQRGEEVSEQLTAVWNGYKVTAEETELYVDKLAAVAATTAADLEELSTGMSKVASAANAMGVDFDDLNAQLATIVSVTRQTPESVGTALKTIYARLGDLKTDGTDEFGVSLGEVSSQLSSMGIQILDTNGDLRDMTTVMAEVAEKWQGWTAAQRQAAAVAMAGKRQYNNLIALFENWDMYTDALETSADAMGTLQHQQDIYMESTEAKLQRLRTTWQGLYDDLVDTDDINTGIDALTDLVQVLDNFVSSFGGGLKTIAGFGAIVSNIFSKQIANGINDAIQKQNIFKQNLELAQANDLIRANGIRELGEGASPYEIAAAENTKIQLEYAEKIYHARAGLNQEQYNTLIGYQKEIGNLQEQITLNDQLMKKSGEKLASEEEYNAILQEGEDAVYRLQDKYDNLIIDLKESQTLTDTLVRGVLNGTYDDVSAQLASLSKYSKELTAEEFKRYKTIINEIHSKDDLANREKQIIQLFARSYKQQIDGANAAKKAAEEINSARIKGIDLEAAKQGYEQQAEGMLNTANSAATLIQRITTITSSLSNMAMAWSSVNALMSTWNDDNATIGEKLLQTLMTLGMTIPVAVNGFKNFNEALVITEGVETALTNAININTLSTEANNKIREANALKMEYQLTLAQTGAAQTTLLTQAQNLESDAEVLNTHVKRLRNIESNKSIVALFQEAFAIKTGTLNLGANTNATILNAAARAAWMAGIMAAIAVIAIITKRIQAWHEAQVAEAKATLESAQATQEIIKVNQELVKTYEDLYKKYEETGEGKDELIKSSFELIDAYNIENGRILALSNQYDELNKRIKEKIKNELEDQKVSARTGAESAAKQAAESASTGLGSTFLAGAGNYQTNLAALTNQVNAGIDFKGPLKELRSNFGYTKINYEEDPQQMMDYINLINESIEYIRALPQEQRESFKGIYDELITEQGQLAEAADTLKEQLDLLYSSEVQSQFLDFDFENSNLNKLYDKINEVKDNLKDIVPEDQIDNFIDSYIDGIEGINISIEKINIAEKFAEQTDEGINEVLSKIENFNEGQLGYLALHLDTAILDGDLNQWLEDHKDIIEAYGKMASSDAFKSTISGYDKDNGFTQQQQDNLYSEDSTTAEYMPVSQSEFSIMDQSQQLSVVTAAWIENTKAVVDNKKEIVDSLQDEIDSLRAVGKATDESGKTLSERGAEAIRTIDDLANKSEVYKERTSEVKQAIIALSEKGYDELDPTQQAIITNFSDYNDVSQDQLKIYGKQIKEAEEYDNQLNALIEEQERIQQTTVDYDSFIQQLNADQAEHGAIMNDIQSAYESLISIVDSYNESGAFTIDQVQQLMTMDDAYVSTLQFENGQLVLNEQAFQNLTIAKIDDMEQTAIATAAEELEALAHQNSAEAAIQNGQATSWAATMAREGAAAAIEGAAAWTAYANAMRAAANVTDSKYDTKAKEITDALQARLQAAENAKNQVRSGGVPMRTAMGVSVPKSSGGKGGGSEKEKEDKEFIEDEIDVLHSLEKQLESLEYQVERLDKAREHLRGKDLRASLKQENKLLNQQIHAYKELIKGEEKQAGIEKRKLKEANIGIKFDKNNNITNYAETQQKIEDQYNAAIRKYNKSAKAEADEKILEAAKTQHDNLLKSIEEYEDHVEKAEDYRDDREEARSKKRENNLKSWETRFQIKIDKRQAQREWNSLKKTMNTDIQKVFKDYSLEAKNAVQDVRTYTNEKGNGTFDLTLKQIKEVEAEIDKLNTKGKSSMFDNVDQAQTRLEELWKDLQSHTEEINQLWQDTWSAYLDNIDQAADKFQTLQDEFDRLTDTLEYQAQVIELVYGEKSYEKLGNIYQDQFDTTIGQIKNLETESETWMNLLKDRFEKTGHTMDDMFSWDEDELRFYNNWMSAQEKINDKNLQALQISKQIYQNSINENMDQLERGLLNGSTLEEVEYEWERIRKEQEKYYDSAEKTYQIQTLANKMDKEINATNNLKTQQKLLKIRNQEIELLREKDKLTEYDIKRADLRYQLELKQMALEDARNNKTSMKLTRNEQGNWTYQYVANEDDVASKQQELLDVWNELYQLEDEYYVKVKENMISTTKEYLESVRQIEEARMNNLISEEEKVQKLAQLQQDYTSDMKELASEEAAHRDGLQIASMGLTAQAVEFDRNAYEGLTEAEKAMVEGLKTANINTYEDYKVIVEGKFDEFLKNKEEHYKAEAREAGLTEKQIQEYVEARMKETRDQLVKVKDKSNETMRETRDDWDDKTHEMSDMWNGNSDSVKNQIDQAYTDMDNADFIFRNQVEETASASGQNFDEFGTHVSWVTDDINWLTTQTSLLADETQSSTTAMQGYVDQVRRAWDLVKDAVFGAHEEFKDYVKDAKETGDLETIHKIKIVYESEDPPDTTPRSSGGGDSSSSGGSNSSGGDNNFDGEADNKIKTNPLKYSIYYRRKTDREYSYATATSDFSTAKKLVKNAFNTLSDLASAKIENTETEKFATYGSAGAVNTNKMKLRTGGYTGSWGDESGRLAVLHQKELVLNKQDTSNFLEGINMIRDMSSLNGSISNAILKAMANTALSLNSLKPGTISGGTTNSNTENTFNITAEFPNAENVNDIREAILSLPNIASQYANQHKL